MTFFDAHLHLSECSLLPRIPKNHNYYGLTSSMNGEQFEKESLMIKNAPSNIHFFRSFGIHPWYLNREQLNYLKSLLKDNQIDAIGECGLDYYSAELKATREEQIKFYLIQLELAEKYQKCAVIHGRKCIEDFFRYSDMLKSLPAVIFHSWSGTFTEADHLISKGVNAYFSFGKELIKGKKSAIECVHKLNGNRLLLETDAPYNTFKDQKETSGTEIIEVYEKAQILRNQMIEADPLKIFTNRFE